MTEARAVTWGQLASAAPALAAAGRKHLYQWDIGLAFLATVRADGGPRVHPVCPVISDEAVHVLVMAGPKQRDLLRDSRYSLHSETCPPPRHDDGFAISGRAHLVTDSGVRQRFAEQLVAERTEQIPWPTFEQDLLFELTIERCLLMQTLPDEPFPAGPTVWRA